MRTIWLCLIVVLACLALTLVPNFSNATIDTGNPGIGIAQAVNADPPGLQSQAKLLIISNYNAGSTNPRPAPENLACNYTTCVKCATAEVSILNCPHNGVPIPDYGDTTGMTTNSGHGSDGRFAIYNLSWPGSPTL